MKVIRILILLWIVSAFSGCVVLAPLIQSYKETGISEGDRKQLLSQSVKEFNEALFWGRVDTALALADASVHDQLRKEVRKKRKSERLVESNIEYVDFKDGARKADVDVLVRFFKVPVYIVKERIERQRWIFALGSGWKLSGREVIEEDNA